MVRALLRLLIVSVATAVMLTAKAQVSDDFSDGNFNIGTVWTGSDALFAVVDDGGNQRLRSASPGAANYWLSTPSTLADDAVWELFFDLRFATSGANFVDVHLMSSAADLASGVNGYIVRIGGTADRLELFRSDAGAAASLAVQSPDGVVNSSSSNPFRLKVTRNAGGLFTLQYDDGNTGSYTTAGSVTDATYISATHFGIRIEQSAAASAVNNHFFDDISVAPIPVDNTPPAIVSVSATSATQVDVHYSEPLDPDFVGSYDIVPFIGVSGQVLDGADATLVHVTPAIALTNGNTYGLNGSGALDLAGNASIDAGVFQFQYVVPEIALPGEVAINEIMADPTPTAGLPEAEFVEIHNTTANKTFDLAGWTFSDGGTTAMLPDVTLPPGGYAIIVDDATAPLFSAFASVIVVSAFPSLNNDGDPLELKNDAGATIDAVTYSINWYQDALKADGGWTLERIDPATPCTGAANWIASNDPSGGTPSAQNSVFSIEPDITPPALLNVLVNDANTIALVFSEAMDQGSLTTGSYTITPSIAVAGASVTGANSVQLNLADALTVGVFYGITVAAVSDCPGNVIGPANTASFALPEPVEAGDLVINEALYDPVGTGADFVELYNRSNKTLSLQGLQMANESDGAIANLRVITNEPYLMLPGEYIVLTPNSNDIATRYPQGRTERFLQMSLPAYNNGNGAVVLLDGANAVLDLFRYDDALHITLMNATEGYSLERVDPARATDDPTNWHTASDVAGKATPGFGNSQFSPAPSASGQMTIDPAIFSPDQDGYQDLLTIAYRFDQPGFVGTIVIYDVAGREARRLMENQLLGAEGAISWDGILDGGSKGRMGPYVVVLEAYDLSGDVEIHRKTVTLAHKLD